MWLQLLGARTDWVPSGRQQMQVGGVLWVQYLGCNSLLVLRFVCSLQVVAGAGLLPAAISTATGCQ